VAGLIGRHRSPGTAPHGNADHSVFYYPYASFASDDSRQLLRIAAFYFDKLFFLDPLKAIGGGVAVSDELVSELDLLEREGILERVSPEDVLHQFEDAIVATVKEDLADPAFSRLCESQPQQTWTLALAKVPASLRTDALFAPLDASMARMLGQFPRGLSPNVPRYLENLMHATAYDEQGGAMSGRVEFRYVDLPLVVGESIMLNHALFGALLHTQSTPLATEAFHDEALRIKMARALQKPAIRQAVEDRRRELKQDLLAYPLLADRQLGLPILDLSIPLEAVLEVRHRHGDELAAARDDLAWLARSIRQEPWTAEFEGELDAKVVPEVHKRLGEARKAVESASAGWLRTALSAAKVPTAVAVAVVPLVIAAAPALPIAIATIAAAGVTAGSGLLDLYDRWTAGRDQGNGLQYLVRLKT
jgi:hypothetical protein